MTFGERAYEACKAKGLSVSRRLTPSEWKETVQLAFDEAMQELQADQKSPSISKREQTELFNALAMACGANPLECPSAMKKSIAVALADIRSVSPNLTCDEISRRARAYRNKHRDWPLTPASLCKYWGSFSENADLGRTFAAVQQLEPPNWKAVMPEIMEGSDPASIGYVMDTLGWNKLSDTMRGTIRKRLATQNLE